MTYLIREERFGQVALIEINSPPVNASSMAVRRQLLDSLQNVISDDSVKAIVIACAGRTFMAGADISEFDAEPMPLPDPNDVFQLMDCSRCLIIAALHGNVLGGGLELALACHYRVAHAKTMLGLPEVKLGVIPGAGGTLRLPRLIGLQPALDMMLTGKSVSADQAAAISLIDEVVDSAVMTFAVTYAQGLLEREAPLRVTSQLPRPIESASFFEQIRRLQLSNEKGGQAAHAIIDSVERGLAASFNNALFFERQQFNECRKSAASAALRHIFFAEREAARIPGLANSALLRSIEKVGIVGAGTMGGGIAMNFANAGIPILLVDIKPDALERGLRLVRKNYEASAAKGRLSKHDVERRMALISSSLSYADLLACDLVIEAAYENWNVKKAVCQQLGEVCKAGAIIATNTSSLNVDALAVASGRASDFVGMHFFSPANVMRLLEVVRGAQTSTDVLATVMALAKRIGKVAVVSGVCFGFIGNRMLEGYLRETEFLLMEGATASQIDNALESFGMAMGPCKMIDMAGVDVAAKVVIERLKDNGDRGDPAYRVVVRELNRLGRFGQKTSAGYYRYEGRKAIDDPKVQEIVASLALQYGVTMRQCISDEEIVYRCLASLINEGGKILDEGISSRPGDIDVVWVSGYGFPAYLGGPMHMANTVGLQFFAECMKKFAAANGDPYGYWNVSDWIVRGVTFESKV